MIDLAEDRDRFQKLLHQARPEAAGKRHRLFRRAGPLIAGQLGCRWSSARPTCSAAAPCRSSATRKPQLLSARHAAGTGSRRDPGEISERQDRPDQHPARHQPAAVRPLPGRRHRSRRRRLCDGKDVLSAASWNTSRKPASTPATAPVPCRRSRCRRMIEELKRQTEALALGTGSRRPDERAIRHQGRRIYVLEVNPRASRTVPFVAKTIGDPVAKIASRTWPIMALAKASP
jgi:carbamoyl-phosphate synthase large subunit